MRKKDPLWELKLIEHKKLIVELTRINIDDKTKLNNLMRKIKQTGINLSLHYANYACQKCDSKDKLTTHHAVKRYQRKLMNDDKRYLSARAYWNCIVILCAKCHTVADGFPERAANKMASISKEKIEEIKNIFKKKEIVQKKCSCKCTCGNIKEK